MITLGNARKLEWLKFDVNSVDVLILVTKEFLYWAIRKSIDENDENEWSILENISNNYGDLNIDDLYDILCKLFRNHHIYWDFKNINGSYFLDMFASDLDPFDEYFDNFEVLEFNVSSYKLPTFILKKN